MGRKCKLIADFGQVIFKEQLNLINLILTFCQNCLYSEEKKIPFNNLELGFFYVTLGSFCESVVVIESDTARL